MHSLSNMPWFFFVQNIFSNAVLKLGEMKNMFLFWRICERYDMVVLKCKILLEDVMSLVLMVHELKVLKFVFFLNFIKNDLWEKSCVFLVRSILWIRSMKDFFFKLMLLSWWICVLYEVKISFEDIMLPMLMFLLWNYIYHDAFMQIKKILQGCLMLPVLYVIAIFL